MPTKKELQEKLDWLQQNNTILAKTIEVSENVLKD